MIGVGAGVLLLALFLFGLPDDGREVGQSSSEAELERSHRDGRDARRKTDGGYGSDGATADRPADEPGLQGLSEELALDEAAEARRKRAEELENDPNTQVVCDLGLDVPTGTAYLAIGGHSGFNGRRVEVVDGKAYLPLVYDLGELGDAVFSERSGTFSLEGYGPQSISWSDPPEDGSHGYCTTEVEPEPGHASLTGTLLLDPSGAPAAGGWVEGCGNMAFADGHGIVHMDIVSEPCTVIAMRQDGMLRTVSEPVAVVPIPGQDVAVDFVIPEAKRAGVGVQLSQTEAGLLIEGLIEGGPASTAGLEPGDLLVEVDGMSVDDHSLGELVKRIGGEAGTEVGLVVDRDGQRLEMTVVRQELTPG